MRWTGGGACTGDYAASLGKVPLPVAKLTGRVASLASLATRLGLDLDTFYLLQTAVQSEREGGVESVEVPLELLARQAREYGPVITRGDQPGTLLVCLRELRSFKNET